MRGHQLGDGMKARGLTRTGHDYQPYMELYAAVIKRAVQDIDKGGKTAQEAETFLQDVLKDNFFRVEQSRRHKQKHPARSDGLSAGGQCAGHAPG